MNKVFPTQNQKLIEFIPAGELKKHFQVFGHFYSVELDSGERIECRSVLEIAGMQSSGREALLDEAPDAIFIMMNPGSSQPLEEVRNLISANSINQLDVSLVPTKPDTTQYQVMRVMRHFGWNHVRVLNISDIREAKSNIFVGRFREIEERTAFVAHSLFADERSAELRRKLIKKSGAPIVCAWGVSPDLEPLIERCLMQMNGESGLTGLLKLGTTNKYFHPLPTLQKDKQRWVRELVAHLRRN
ncbi:MAG: hypothetical protein PXX77_01490 [Gallionella sp.]|nr:hypothetical protein [Gallionella sp.]